MIEDNTTPPVLHQKSNSETSNNDINNNQWNLLPESNGYFENYHSTTLKNRIESSDVTFEEVLSIYVKRDFKEGLT